MLLSLLLLSPLLAQQAVSEPEAFQVHAGGGGLETFLVAHPDAATSAASRLNLDRAAKDGVVPAPTGGFELTSTVLVETAELGDLAALATSIDAAAVVAPLGFLDGFSTVGLGSVRAAIAMSNALEEVYGSGQAYLDVDRPKHLRVLPSDPGFGNQWHLHNTSLPIADINAEPAWTNGFTGTGATVGILEWGVEHTHQDLSANYNATASQNAGTSSHGTSCAGVAAADDNNGRGGVGLAYDAQWSEQLAGSSSQTASAFQFRNDLNDVKSNSWGPADDGRLHYFSSTELNALASSCANGRGGLGEVFTWAAGNGGTGDRVEYDPYASSRYTIAVGAIGDQDKRSSYNELGSSMTVVCQSSGNNRGIYTTTSGNGYTSGFGGTSSASPLGAGAVALVLDANPSLTWRDVQHVLIHSARKCDPTNNQWELNGAGHDINYNFGFGAVEANDATQLAQGWTNVSAEQSWSSGVVSVNQALPDNNPVGIDRMVNVPAGIYCEAVELVVNISHNNVGDIRVELSSPDGTLSALTKVRSDSQNNFTNYILTSLRHWDELASGDWKVHVSDRQAGTTGTWTNFELRVFGNDGSHLGGGGSFTLSSTTLTAGTSATMSVANGAAGAAAYLAYSLQGLGSFPVPQLGVTLGLSNPVQGGSGIVLNGSGAGSWTLPVPAGAAGVHVWMQSCQSGLVSNIIDSVVQ
ncbi:MAG: S8 family serine peptidase [Planctomycetes bacterium]|nr:S8 family serine peptidase [Planctomycetota bacterium]